MNTHDYTVHMWGHNFEVRVVYEGGRELDLVGWGPLAGPLIEAGDVLILRDEARYEVTSVQYVKNPPDMWWATVRRCSTSSFSTPAYQTRDALRFAWLPCRVSLPDGSTRWTWLTTYLLVEVQRAYPTDEFQTRYRWETLARLVTPNP